MAKLSDEMKKIQHQRKEALDRAMDAWINMDRGIAHHKSLLNQLFDWFITEVSQGDSYLHISKDDDGVYYCRIEVKTGKNTFSVNGIAHADRVELKIGNQSFGSSDLTQLKESLEQKFLAWYKEIQLSSL
ncbi:hypothetical protein [Alicyclobacillus sendaiensis]|uniref:Uncharacterized protein n=1 Tax=Alicyclobacillus sendaiensis PA2 TaxID=3029425 RepID=A0ABT6Y1R0_ALISE|nr:hypothetical protein [Alicyclobacillus sendaiensis]MDI9261296.1 hypothetical protein [Alicyclobacillus sendaiensis PA2]